MLSGDTTLAILLPLRVCCGWVLCTAGLGKLESGWLTHPGVALSARVEAWLQAGRTYRFFVPALHHLLHHAQAASIAVVAVELLAGAALLCGLFSRWAALCGLAVAGAYLLAAGDGLGANPSAPLCAALLTLSLCSSGRVLGLDAALQGRLPGWIS